ncbi:transposase [Bacillus halotolerans]|uniref:transposase n=1 Tax=Bacillus halotolerans TaxID=260554 RepID=UPI002DBDD6C2|nr:transposase [Bacillus halotolerans]MEC1646357.1 transposase [Bacillus halotolerans]
MLDTKERLYQFYNLVETSGLKEFHKAIETFHNCRKKLNSFAFVLHNAYVGRINNQTKVIKHNAFGFGRYDRFQDRVLLHHQYKHINLRVS